MLYNQNGSDNIIRAIFIGNFKVTQNESDNI